MKNTASHIYPGIFSEKLMLSIFQKYRKRGQPARYAEISESLPGIIVALTFLPEFLESSVEKIPF